MMLVIQTHCVNHVVHQLVNFGPLEPRLAAVPHYFGVGSYNIVYPHDECQPLLSAIITHQ